MPGRPAAVDLLAALSAVFARRRLRWYVFGAQAVVAYGTPRMTADVDVTVALGKVRLEDLLVDLRKARFLPRVARLAQLVAETRVVALLHQPTAMPVDVVLAGPGLEEEFIARARPRDLGGVRVPVISVEDLLVTKLLAGRAKDLDDVRGLLLQRAKRLDLRRTRRVLRMLEEGLGRSDLVTTFDLLVREARTG